ncbi:MAG: N-acetylmuramoyl-L-alanine amidase [Alphaproteobacteria bacterium]|nr:N-acetylmuramoyl-L-alanine amidase [Alphaproteobacteria bacterium]
MQDSRRNIWRSGGVLLLALVGAANAAGSAESGVRATGVRIGSHGEETRFVVDLSGQVRHRTFTIAQPNRVVIDLPKLGWRARREGPRRHNAVIRRYRFGAFTAGANRIVIELRQPAEITRAFVLPPRGKVRNYRFVLDLKPVSQEAFLKSVRRPVRRQSGNRTVRRTPRGKRPPSHKPVIVLDPGHGGIDPGTRGRRGTREKHVTFLVARAVRRRLLATGKYKVVMTRNGDTFVPLRTRIAIARKAEGDLFVSLHADALFIKSFRGAAVYTLSEKASDHEAAALAKKENKSDIIAGIDLGRESGEVRNILIDLAQRETMNRSIRLARFLIDDLRREIKLVRNKKHRFAGFAVLRAPDVPSVLIELGYLSNAADERLLRSPSHHAKLARAIVRAINRYIALQSKLSKS